MTYEQTKRHYTKLLSEGHPTGEYYLCLTDTEGRFGEFTHKQNGYVNALERTPVPLPKTCEHCGQEIPMTEEPTYESKDYKD